MKPLKLKPVFKDYLWGGDKLKTQFGKVTEISPLAESWELSAHKDGECTILNTEYKGCTLSEYINKVGKSVIGTKAEKLDYFPILIKLIDAKQNLSVQVHPNDKYALENEGEYGKTEMWYILDCEENAYLYYGFSKDITREEYERAIKENSLTDILNKVPVSKGDVFFIHAGTVHAIGAGIVICEIQQNSNTTYRVYDYGRTDKDGKTRPLHIEKALDVSTLKKAPNLEKTPPGNDVLLAECEYFTARRLHITDEKQQEITLGSFHSLIITEGSGKLYLGEYEISLDKGDSFFIPAQNNTYCIRGEVEIILSQL